MPESVCDHSEARGFTSLQQEEVEYNFSGFIPTNKQTNKHQVGFAAALRTDKVHLTPNRDKYSTS